MRTTVDLDEEPLDTRDGVPLLPRKPGASPVTSKKVKDLLESEAANERKLHAFACAFSQAVAAKLRA
jgi:hypothetical protein